MRDPYLKILDLANLFVANAPMKKKSRNLVLPPSQSTLKYGSDNRVGLFLPTLNMEPVVVGRRKKDTVCPGSSDPFFIVTYYIKWVTTGTHST